MDFNDAHFVWIAYIISNMVGWLYLFVAVKKTWIARLMFFLLFSWASWLNLNTASQHPEVYLVYAEKSISIYTDFIQGWFKNHITLFVSCVAVGQGMIAVGMLLKGVWVKLACIGAIIFLLAIAPLGLNSAFPFSLFVSAAAYFIIRNDDKRYLWERRKKLAF
jgi:hypothetical protein